MNPHRQNADLLLTQAGEGSIGENCLMNMGFYCGVMEVFGNQIEVVVAQCCEYSKCHRIAHFKTVSYMLCEFHLNK